MGTLSRVFMKRQTRLLRNLGGDRRARVARPLEHPFDHLSASELMIQVVINILHVRQTRRGVHKKNSSGSVSFVCIGDLFPFHESSWV